MLLVAVAGAFGLGVMVILSLYLVLTDERTKLEQRVDKVVGAPAALPAREEELKLSLYRRALRPAFSALAVKVIKVMPVAREETLAKKIRQAGNPGNLAPRELLVIKYVLTAGVAVIFSLLGGALGYTGTKLILVALVGLPVGWLLPDLLLQSKARQRKEDVEKKLPDMMDLLTVSVEAGLGFDGAMQKVAGQSRGVLADELTQVLREVRMGKARSEALREMADRLGVNDMSNFVGSIILAERLGISIGNVLRVQSNQMRQKRRQRAEEKAMQAPVKMLFPLVFFIFPTIMVVLLGPAVIQIMETFM